MLECCVRRRLSVTLYIVAKRCVLGQTLLLTAYRKSYIYEKSIGTKMNDLDSLFRGRIEVTPTIALHLTLNITETVRDRGLVPKDHQWEMAYGLSNGQVTDVVT